MTIRTMVVEAEAQDLRVGDLFHEPDVFTYYRVISVTVTVAFVNVLVDAWNGRTSRLYGWDEPVFILPGTERVSTPAPDADFVGL